MMVNKEEKEECEPGNEEKDDVEEIAEGSEEIVPGVEEEISEQSEKEGSSEQDEESVPEVEEKEEPDSMLEEKHSQMGELKKKIESVLFSAGRKVNIEEIVKLCGAKEGDVRKALKELEEDYKESESAIMLVEEGNSWKLTVREKFLPIVQKIVTETELSKTVMETLAVIAFKHPVLQSEVIKIRTNKAYDHLRELEESGYITREKHGRTKKIRLTKKFFDYFDLPPTKVKDAFADLKVVEEAIKEKEEEAKRLKEEVAKKRKEEKKLGELEVFEKTPEEVEKEKKKEEERKRAEEESKQRMLGKCEIVEGQAVTKEATTTGDKGSVGEKEIEKQERKLAKLEEKKQELEEGAGDFGTISAPESEPEEETPSPYNDEEVDKRAEHILHPDKNGITVNPEIKEKVEKRVEELFDPELEQKRKEKEIEEEKEE
jgi:segregation and condensation protein B